MKLSGSMLRAINDALLKQDTIEPSGRIPRIVANIIVGRTRLQQIVQTTNRKMANNRYPEECDTDKRTDNQGVMLRALHPPLLCPGYAMSSWFGYSQAIASWDHRHYGCARALDIPTLMVARSRLLSQPL